MPERDDLREAFDDLYTTALPGVRPPGVAAARRRVNRRRTVRTGAATAGALAAVALAGALLVPGGPTGPRSFDGAGPPNPVQTSPSAVPATSQPPGSTSGGSRARQPAKSTKSTSPKSPHTACIPRGRVNVTPPDGAGEVVASVAQKRTGPGGLCPGERVRVFWATYQVDEEGIERLHASQAYTLDEEQPEVRFTLDLPAEECRSYYVASGDEEIKASVAPGDVAYRATWLSAPPNASCRPA